MKREKKSEAVLHSAGAIVRHKSIFESLESYENKEEISIAFKHEWVNPFYMKLSKKEIEWIEFVAEKFDEITDKIILKNLGDFNWRSRSTGAFFTSLKDKKKFIDIIGTHLLKSELCYAGREYAITLAYFNEPSSIEYLTKYLDYYLDHPELDFDQKNIIATLKYLDEANNTNHIKSYFDRWEKFNLEQFRIRKKYYRIVRKKYDINLPAEKIKFEESSLNIKTENVKTRIDTLDKIRDITKGRK